MKNKLTLYIIVCASLLLISTTFCFIGVKVYKEGNGGTVEFKTGSFNLRIKDSKISNVKLDPIYDNSYETSYKKDFTIESYNSTLSSCVALSLNITKIDEELKSEFVKFKLLINDKEYNGNFKEASGVENLLLARNIYVEPNNSINGTLYIWLSYDQRVNQTNMLDKKFNSKLSIIGYDSQMKCE